jgi:hypothetical protein
VGESDEREDDSEYHNSRPRSRQAPSVIFKSEPDLWLRTGVAAVVALLSFISFTAYTGNREAGEMRTEIAAIRNEVKLYADVMDRRVSALEILMQQLLLERGRE